MFVFLRLRNKGAYDQVFKTQKRKPVAYIAITVDPRNVDVNCDPCKAKVRILRDVDAASALRERVVAMLQTFEDTQKKVASQLQQALTGLNKKERERQKEEIDHFDGICFLD